MAIESTVQRLSPGAQVILFDLDMSAIGGGVFRFIQGTINDAPVRWKGNVYTAVPIEASGFEWNGQGSLPTPRLSMGTITIVTAAIQSFDDLRGCRVVRWRTFAQYLDGMPEADSSYHFRPEVYYIERKTSLNTRKKMVEWELAAASDLHGRSIPRRVALRNVCPFTYRQWQGASFSYFNATCPYNGSRMFTRTGDATGDPAQDNCGKAFSDCQKRFGFGNPLPYGGYPGVGRVR
jgi:lambda family phage minor tail protein L